jgi:hypothetical protein
MQVEHDVWNTPDVHRAIRRELANHFRRAMTYRSPCPIGCKRYWTSLTEPSAEGETAAALCKF